MTDIPHFAPGCFGSALAYKDEDSVCMGCVFKAQCQPIHLEARAALRARLGIKLPEEIKAARPAVTKVEFKDQSPEALALPIKVQELINKLDEGGYNVIENMRAGINPFGAAMKHMKIACHLLLRMPLDKGIDQGLLTTMFVKHLGWAENTSAAQARQVVQALTHIGLVDNNQGTIFLRRSQ